MSGLGGVYIWYMVHRLANINKSFVVFNQNYRLIRRQPQFWSSKSKDLNGYLELEEFNSSDLIMPNSSDFDGIYPYLIQRN